jgi:uncharacterized membrane protein YagU involved in acid resistance
MVLSPFSTGEEYMTQVQNNAQAHSIQEVWKGTLAGFVATVPMTIFMLATQRFLPRRQQYRLPPEMITSELAHRAHVRHHLNKQQVVGATLVSHFGYGAAMGAAYGPLQKRVPLPAIVQGVMYGIVVWAASYLGLLPALGISASGHREPMRRNLMMIVAHVVWGAALGAAAGVLFHKEEDNSGAQ